MEYQWTTGPKMDPASPFSHLQQESKKRTSSQSTPSRKKSWDRLRRKHPNTTPSNQEHIAPSIHQGRKQFLTSVPRIRSPSISPSNHSPHPPLPPQSSASPLSQHRANLTSISHQGRRTCHLQKMRTMRIHRTRPSRGSATHYSRCTDASLLVPGEGRSRVRSTTQMLSLGGLKSGGEGIRSLAGRSERTATTRVIGRAAARDGRRNPRNKGRNPTQNGLNLECRSFPSSSPCWRDTPTSPASCRGGPSSWLTSLSSRSPCTSSSRLCQRYVRSSTKLRRWPRTKS